MQQEECKLLLLQCGAFILLLASIEGDCKYLFGFRKAGCALALKKEIFYINIRTALRI